MTVMFQEEVSRLRLQLTDAQEQISASEREHQRLADLVKTEQQKTRDAEKKADGLRSDLDEALPKLAEAQRSVALLAKMESEMLAAQGEERKANNRAKRLREELTETTAALAQTKERYAETNRRLTKALEQIEPLVNLVDALKKRHNADVVIASELGRLDLAK